MSPPAFEFDPSRLPGEVTLDHLAPARAATWADLPRDLDPALVGSLRRRGVERLYSHQAAAYASVRAGHDLVVVTPTASGKSLCYNLPVLQRVLEEPHSRALYLFPTKALAQDQLAELSELASGLPVRLRADTYDGDTPPGERTAIREAGHVVLTNPDMLHSGILPHHTRWRSLFSSLQYVVIDELHTYRGLFGSHVANVIRRLQRVCEFYGSRPVFVCASATIANPGELAERLLERPVDLVTESGAPQGERRLVFYNPPLVNRELGIRRSSLLEGQRIAAPLIQAGLQTIVFCRSRLQVEIMLSYLRQAVASKSDRRLRIHGYRSGYLPRQRREIEAGLRSGEVAGVVSTNALELGIDIGSMRAAVLVGYPGTIASTWQQLGRAGRRGGSLAVMVASSAPLDQFIVRHPEYFLGANPEQGLIDPDNLLVLAGHLEAGLFELPFLESEGLGRADVGALLELFHEDGSVSQAGGRYYWSRQAFPAEGLSLRRMASDNVVIIDVSPPRPEVVGEMDQFSAQVMLHEEAIYIQDGAQYHVDRLDWEEKKAYVRPVDVDYYTDAMLAVTVNVLETFAQDEGAFLGRHHGEIKVSALASMFKKIRFHSHENIGSGPISLPEQTLHTTAYWTTVDTARGPALSRAQMESAIQGMAHSLRNVAALHLMCDPRDLGALGEIRSTATMRPTVTVYEVYPGGVGYSKRLFELHQQLLDDAADLVRSCPCSDGCPSCVGPLGGAEGGKTACLQLLCVNALPV